MPKLTLVHSVISQLQQERTRLQNELYRVSAALTAFGDVYRRGKSKPTPVRKKHKISAAGRKRIAAAQKARWARIRARKR